jgi:hypothetical protein
MLMGIQPRPGRSGGARGQGKLDLDLLPACDRPVLARALSADPGQRFGSCGEFLAALNEAASEPGAPEKRLPEVVPVADLLGGPPPSSGPTPAVEQITTGWLMAATGAKAIRQHGVLRYLMFGEHVIEHRYPVRIIPGVLRLKLHDLPQQLKAVVVRREANELVCRIPAEQSFLQRCLGGEHGLIVQVNVPPATGPNPQLVEALVRVEVYGVRNKAQLDELSKAGPLLLTTVRTYLEEDQERRRHERWPCKFSLHVIPVSPEGNLGEPIVAAADTLSHLGIEFHVDQPLRTEQVYVAPREAGPIGQYGLLVNLSHHVPTADGSFSVGGYFGPAETPAN